MLRINNLCRQGLLHSISLTVNRAECVCIQGESGAGKTLLLRAIADLDVNTGDVSLNDTPREDYTAEAWRRHVAFVPAESYWWSETVQEHFETINPELLAELGFAQETLEWQVQRLSTGERHRLAILRAIFIEPDVLLVDEPTANLDAANSQRVEELLVRCAKEHGMGLLWVTHSVGQIDRIADRVFSMKQGRLHEVQP